MQEQGHCLNDKSVGKYQALCPKKQICFIICIYGVIHHMDNTFFFKYFSIHFLNFIIMIIHIIYALLDIFLSNNFTIRIKSVLKL